MPYFQAISAMVLLTTTTTVAACGLLRARHCDENLNDEIRCSEYMNCMILPLLNLAGRELGSYKIIVLQTSGIDRAWGPLLYSCESIDRAWGPCRPVRTIPFCPV
jgi:hypothetical protein